MWPEEVPTFWTSPNIPAVFLYLEVNRHCCWARWTNRFIFHSLGYTDINILTLFNVSLTVEILNRTWQATIKKVLTEAFIHPRMYSNHFRLAGVAELHCGVTCSIELGLKYMVCRVCNLGHILKLSWHHAGYMVCKSKFVTVGVRKDIQTTT